MVNLADGTLLSYEEIKALADYVRKRGVLQFISLYNKTKDRHDDPLLWGDEIEYMVVRLDDAAKKATLSLRAAELLAELQQEERQNPEKAKCLWSPEYNNFVIEGKPGHPFGPSLSDIRDVQANMKHRRKEARTKLQGSETLLTLTSFPRLGCPGFSTPPFDPKPESSSSRSLFLPDEAVFPHLVFQSLASNARKQRGEKVVINIPKRATPRPFLDGFNALGDDGERGKNALPDHIYMDALSFGLGCCSLQVTFQAYDLNEARTLHDQLATFGPIMMALTAASPLHRGLIADTDCRWNLLYSASDWRTRQEGGFDALATDKYMMQRPRWSSISTYISPEAEKYNDTLHVYDEEAYATLIAAGVDHNLARHVAYLFLRDVSALYKEQIDNSDKEGTDFFDLHQLTTWQTVRFKPPSLSGAIGWQVEFRTCEVQITDFENAAVATFMVLLRRVILSYKLRFVVPISKIDDNMERAQKRDAILNQKFWFRTDITTDNSPAVAMEVCNRNCLNLIWSELTINEIVNGKEGLFIGLVPLVKSYVKTEELDNESRNLIDKYLQFFELRASGELMTDAKWIRHFVLNHPDYKHDSVVSESVNYDLLKTIDKIVKGEIGCPLLVNSRFQNGL